MFNSKHKTRRPARRKVQADRGLTLCSPKAVGACRFICGQHPPERDERAQIAQEDGIHPVQGGHEMVRAPVPLEVRARGQEVDDGSLQG